MLDFDPQRVLVNVRQADTQDLLNRATVYRDGMEPDALPIIERELHDRGVTSAQIEEYHERMNRQVIQCEGIAVRCSFCNGPAVAEAWGWHRLWGKLPLFPRRLYYCLEHRPIRQKP
jgi:hypothetical protein